MFPVVYTDFRPTRTGRSTRNTAIPSRSAVPAECGDIAIHPIVKSFPIQVWRTRSLRARTRSPTHYDQATDMPRGLWLLLRHSTVVTLTGVPGTILRARSACSARPSGLGPGPRRAINVVETLMIPGALIHSVVRAQRRDSGAGGLAMHVLNSPADDGRQATPWLGRVVLRSIHGREMSAAINLPPPALGVWDHSDDSERKVDGR